MRNTKDMGMIMHTDGDFKLLCRESQEKLCSVDKREGKNQKKTVWLYFV